MSNPTKLESVAIQVLSRHHHHWIGPALQLLNRTQGQGLFTEAYLLERLQRPTSMVVGAFAGEELIGVAAADLISSFEFYFPYDANLPEKLRGHKVGVFTTMSVTEEFQGCGVGQALARARLQWLKGQGCTVILGTSWVSGLPHSSDRVFEKLGFRVVGRVAEFFVEMSLQRPFVCPACGGPPCRCDAILYRLDLQG